MPFPPKQTKEQDLQIIQRLLPPDFKVLNVAAGYYRATQLTKDPPGANWWPAFKAAMEREFGNRLDSLQPNKETYQIIRIQLNPRR